MRASTIPCPKQYGRIPMLHDNLETSCSTAPVNCHVHHESHAFEEICFILSPMSQNLVFNIWLVVFNHCLFSPVGTNGWLVDTRIVQTGRNHQPDMIIINHYYNHYELLIHIIH